MEISPNQFPAIEFRHVTIAFENVVALRDVSFTLAQNESLLITGASGSGKSVLLRLAMGMLRPDEGQVFVQGHEINAMEEDELLTLRSQQLGLVFQDEALFTALNVYDNTAYRLVEHGWPEDQTDTAVREILTFVGLENDLQKTVWELSGGMKRRLEFARALVGWPAVMLFDEPTTGLDPINAQMARNMILRARDLHQMSALVVTKAMNEIAYLVHHYATRDESGAIVIRESDAAHAEPRRIMVLERGAIAWLGHYTEFSQSALPVITQLLHPQPSAVNPDFHPADPWDKRRATANV
jgi:phospholipid/cholesterol/gamma-HCH transport system ATP-binding protein